MGRVVGFAVFVFLALAAAPADAAGLLQDLFASLERRSAPVVYRYAPAQPQMRFVYDEGFRVSRKTLARKPTAGSRMVGRSRMKGATAKGMTAAKGLPTNDQPRRDFDGLNPKDATTAAIAGDRTLRVGDAYMTTQGLRIYRGRVAGSDKGAFVDYRKAGIDPDTKDRLSAIERSQSPRALSGATTVAASAIEANQPIASRTSIDAAGRLIRVVGP